MKKYRAFLGLCPPEGLIARFREIYRKFSQTSFLQLQPWYKLHLTIFFWPGLTRSEFFYILDFLRQSELSKLGAIPSKIHGIESFGQGRVIFLKETSPEVFSVREKAQEVIFRLPPNLQGEREKEFIPHWTIIRKVQKVQLQNAIFKELENFSHEGKCKALEFYFSASGIYEPHSLSYHQAKAKA